MEYVINKKANKTGKRSVFFITIFGKRVSSTNFIKKNEAIENFKSILKYYGEAKLTELANK